MADKPMVIHEGMMLPEPPPIFVRRKIEWIAPQPRFYPGMVIACDHVTDCTLITVPQLGQCWWTRRNL